MTDATKSAEQIAEEKAQADAAAKAAKAEAKAKADAEKKEAAEKAKAEKAEAKAKADAEKKAAKEKADEEKKAAKEAAEAERKAAAEAKAKEREEKAVSKVKVQLVSQRGVTQPKEGTKTRAVWDLADKLSAGKGAPVAIKELMPQATAAGINDATTRTQYARWKQFHGVYGSVKAATVETPAANEQVAEQAAA